MRTLFAALCAFVVSGQAAEPPAPFGPLPSARQIAWMETDYYGFLHFGLNTYTGKEWGYGDESPSLLNLKNFDAEGMAREAKAAGMGGLIVVAKHHDGFCLWPTDTTPHNIRLAPYKDGKGDIVGEVAAACKKYGIKFGIYVSPWDRNNPGYGRDDYKKTFLDQISEVTERYGDTFMMWFDGANGGDGYYGGARETRKIPKDYYPWDAIRARIRDKQPMASVFGDGGPDVRWVGNERGIAGETCWAVTHAGSGLAGGADYYVDNQLNAGSPKGNVWRPAECDVSIRPGWFYHAAEDNRVKDLRALSHIYFCSVGRGQGLNLNVPPDKTGSWHPKDVAALRTLRTHLDAMFAANLTNDAKATSTMMRGSDTRFSANALLDNNRSTYWCGNDKDLTPTAEISLDKDSTFNVLHIREFTQLGQRVESFALDAWVNGEWSEVATATTIGNQRLLRIPAVTTQKVRLRITGSLAVPCISEFQLYMEPEGARGPEASAVLKKNVGWKITASSNNKQGSSAEAAIDGDSATLWQTHPASGELNPPQWFTVDTGKLRKVKGFFYIPRQDKCLHGMTDRYRFEVSVDGKNWVQLAEAEFGNLRANPQQQSITFPTQVELRHFRFTGLRALEKSHITAAEVGLIE